MRREFSQCIFKANKSQTYLNELSTIAQPKNRKPCLSVYMTNDV